MSNLNTGYDQQAMVGRRYRLHPYGIYTVTGIADADGMTLISPEGQPTRLDNHVVAWSLSEFEVRSTQRQPALPIHRDSQERSASHMSDSLELSRLVLSLVSDLEKVQGDGALEAARRSAAAWKRDAETSQNAKYRVEAQLNAENYAAAARELERRRTR